jgi:hypothetical protein
LNEIKTESGGLSPEQIIPLLHKVFVMYSGELANKLVPNISCMAWVISDGVKLTGPKKLEGAAESKIVVTSDTFY